MGFEKVGAGNMCQIALGFFGEVEKCRICRYYSRLSENMSNIIHSIMNLLKHFNFGSAVGANQSFFFWMECVHTSTNKHRLSFQAWLGDLVMSLLYIS